MSLARFCWVGGTEVGSGFKARADYDRQKWGAAANGLLRLVEYLGGKYANEVIVISRVIQEIVRKRCGRVAHLIPNGVPLPVKSAGTNHLARLGVRRHADLFVLPSYHEGLPIALLEAMSYGLSALVSDIPANKEVELPADRYFRCGNVKDLGEKMASLLERQLTVQEKEALPGAHRRGVRLLTGGRHKSICITDMPTEVHRCARHWSLTKN